MKKAAIVYHYFAHYRAPVFRALAESRETDYYFLGDPQPSNDIRRIDFKNEEKLSGRFIPLKNTWLGKGFLWQSGLLSALRRNHFDNVIFLGDIKFITTWIAILFIRIRGKKAYLWGHGLYGKESWVNLKVKLFLLKLSNGIFLYNNRAKQLYLKNGVSADKLTVIYNSLNFEETDYYRKSYNPGNRKSILSLFTDPGLPVAFCIGRVNKVKRMDLLIKALSILKSRNFNTNCFIIGEGPEKPDLEALVHTLNLQSNVYFVGALYNEKEISQYIMASDLCVCPGPIGLTGIHALSYGVPVISNNNFNLQMPEHEAVTPGLNGDFFEENNIEDLADKMEQCIRMRMEDRKKSVENCYSVIRDYYNPRYQQKTMDAVLARDNQKS